MATFDEAKPTNESVADEASAGGWAPPGAPGPQAPEPEERTEPQEPLPPKPDQGAPETVTATGSPTGAAAKSRAQSGAFLTTSHGARLRDTDHSCKAGPRGPTLLQDHHLREKITHFDHERIPERVVHARGAGAHGFFVGYGTAEPVTRAAFLAKDVETPVFVRFSTVLGSRGSADTVRDTRGFATKFYTDEGTFDLVGNNIPVFFIQDGIKFPDIIHAAKPHPDREIPQAQSAHDTFWDFVSLHTEAQHHTIWNMSDRGIPRSYRTMEGFGVHTFRLINAEGATTLVKFHWKPRLGVHSLTWEEAQMLAGLDPDFHRRDLYDAIEAGAYPQWELGIQAFEDTPEQTFEGIDLLDPTKLVPEELAPVQPLGLLTLNRHPPTSSPRPSRWPSTSATSCPASTSPTTRCSRPGCSPTSTPSSPGWAGRTSTRSPSTGRTRRSTTCCATASTRPPSTRAWRPTGRTRSTAAAPSSPGPAEQRLRRRPGARARDDQGAGRTGHRSTTTSARPGCSG